MAAVSPALREGKLVTPGATWNLINVPNGADYVCIDAITVACKVLLRSVADATAVGTEYVEVTGDGSRSFAVTGLAGINVSSAGDCRILFSPKGM